MELSFFEILSLLKKKIWVILLSALVGLSTAIVITYFFITPSYTSSCQMYVDTKADQTGQAATYTDLQYAQKLVNSYLIILRNESFLDKVASKSALGYTSGQIRKMLSLTSINNTEFFEVKITTTNPIDAFMIVSTLAELAPAEIIRIKESDSVKIISDAKLPTAPSAPNNRLNMIIGTMLGLLISSFLVVLIDVLDTRIKSEDDLLKHYALPILGIIPKYED